MRDAVVPLLSRVPAVQRRAARRYCQMHVAYPVSRLTQPDRYRGGVRPGDRVPNIDVLVGDHRARLHDVLRSGRHVLVTPRADLAGAAAAASALGPQDAVDVVTSDFEAAPGSGGRDGLVFLVRPDGYVAARGRPGDTRAIVSYLRAIRGAGRLAIGDMLTAGTRTESSGGGGMTVPPTSLAGDLRPVIGTPGRRGRGRW